MRYAGQVRVELPYGDSVLAANVPDDAVVLRPRPAEPLADPRAAVAHAIASPVAGPPLARLARAGASATIVVSDITRPVPNDLLLPPVLRALQAGGVAAEDITIIIGAGLHRASRPDERQRMLGDAIPARYRVIDHDARDRSTQEFLLRTPRGIDVWVNREYAKADIRILTGFVEPHLFAGYSGGGKAMLPGICGQEAIMANHDATMISHPRATWCTTDGNPIFEEMRDVALRSDPHFTLNVTLDERKRLTGVFAGELVTAHDAAIAQAASQYIVDIPHAFDVVIVTNMGYPADLSLYQAVKGMSVGAQACATGGVVLLVAECREGLGGPEYVELLRSEESPRALLDRLSVPDHATVHDQWQVQVQAMVQARCDVWLYSSLDRTSTAAAHLVHAADLDGAIERILDERRVLLGRDPSVCVMPHGQLTVPRVSAAA